MMANSDWLRTKIETERDWLKITNLTSGETYDIRIVAVTDVTRETRSDVQVIRLAKFEGILHTTCILVYCMTFRCELGVTDDS